MSENQDTINNKQGKQSIETKNNIDERRETEGRWRNVRPYFLFLWVCGYFDLTRSENEATLY